MRAGMKPQLQTTLVYSIISGVIMFLMEWAGFRGKFRVWSYPLPLADIWWHPPLLIAFAFALIVALRIIHRLLGGSGEL
jgi:hypothetical protein